MSDARASTRRAGPPPAAETRGPSGIGHPAGRCVKRHPAEGGRMSRRTALGHLVVSVGMVALAACATQHGGTTSRSAEGQALRVAVPSETPPYCFRQEGQLVGLEVDFARELGVALGRSV